MPTVRVALLPGWVSEDRGLPEMTLPTAGDIEAGYEGDVWTATKRSWKLEVRWRGDQARYQCAIEKPQHEDQIEHRARRIEVVEVEHREVEAEGLRLRVPAAAQQGLETAIESGDAISAAGEKQRVLPDSASKVQRTAAPIHGCRNGVEYGVRFRILAHGTFTVP